MTGAVFKSRLDQMKTNIHNGKYFRGRELTYHFHVIEYQYRGLPHAHLVAWLEDAYDIDDPNCDNLIDFVNKHFIAEIPRFGGEEFQNIYVSNGEPEFTEKYKQKAVEMVRMNNTDWDSHINVEYSGSAYCALYLYKYCYKGAARKENIDLSF